jgi:hypothetical protein
MAPDLIAPVREAFGFKLDPLKLPDGGLAFVSFLKFASGNSTEAQGLQNAWARDVGKTSLKPIASTKDTASYIDCLIRTQWGEEPQAANDAAVDVSHG